MSKGVMVIGGGLVGIQAALDLAEAQVPVYLVERSPFLGGRVSQLDKIVPDDESSISLLMPKLLAAVKHPHIHILTNSEVTAVTGQQGDFRVSLLRHPSYVDQDKCSGCGRCEQQCPVKLSRELELSSRTGKTIYAPIAKAMPFTYAIEKKGTPPCRDACPAGVNAQGYVALISHGKFREALDLVKERIPFPGVCGRICNHPCEDACNRKEFDDPVAIRDLKRFVADFALNAGDGDGTQPVRTLATTTGRRAKIAVVGAGPAGLTAARDLADMGYRVTVMEASPVVGGMLSLGIPEFRLPREVLGHEIDEIKAHGVEIRPSTRLGDAFTLEHLRQLGYEAIFLAIGAHAPRRLGIPGEDLQGVTDCVTLLRNFNLGRTVKIGRRVVVIGGGNAAVDAARTIIRLQSEKVDVIYRRGKEEMPADEKEVAEAELEGVSFHYLVAPVRITGDQGRVTGIECQRMRLGQPGPDGRRAFEPVPDSDFVLDTDTVVIAVGQAPDMAAIAATSGLATTARGTIAVNELTLATNLPDVFAGGDAVSGPATVIQAIAAGQRAAVSIDRYIRGESLTRGRDMPKREPVHLDPAVEVERLQRHAVPSLSASKRFTTFREVEAGYTVDVAVREAERCLNCAACSECLECEKACDLEAIRHDRQAAALSLEVGAIIAATGFDRKKAAIAGAGHIVRHKNLIGELEFERLVLAQGPRRAHLERPSDGRPLRSIAFLVIEEAEHPDSNVHLMQALRNALLAQSLDPSLQRITVISPRLPAPDRDSLRYLQRAARYPAISIVIGEVVSTRETPDKGVTISVRTPGERSKDYLADLIVLSSAIEPWAGSAALGGVLDVEVQEDGGYVEGESPAASARPGVYLAGSSHLSGDFADDMVQASAAAAKALMDVDARRVRGHEPVAEEGTGDRPTRLGVFLCRCGGNISGVVDFAAVRDHLATIPGNVSVQEVSYACSELGSELILERVRNLGINRVVLGSCICCAYDQLCPSCSPSRIRAKHYLLEAGVLNRDRFEFVNIREQCAWVHGFDPAQSTAKAVDLLNAAMACIADLEPAPARTVHVERGVLVTGGGISGLQCASDLAAQGERVYVANGGKRWTRQPGNPEAARQASLVIERLVNSLRAHKAMVYSETTIETIDGSTGSYEVTMRKGRRTYAMRAGAIVLAGEHDDDRLRVIDMLHLPSLKPASAEEPGALEPGRTVSPAVFLCPAAQDIRDSLVMGSAVASKVAGFLAKEEIAVAPNAATVDVSRCRGCRTCEQVCEYGAVRVVAGLRGSGTAQVDALRCQGCGTCAAHCPTGAIRAGNFAPEQLEDFLRSLLVGV